MAATEIMVLWFWSYLNLYMEFLSDLKGWYIQLTYEQSNKNILVNIRPNPYLHKYKMTATEAKKNYFSHISTSKYNFNLI